MQIIGGIAIKTGVFGGTFNPPHIGHLKLATHAAGRLGLDRILIIPACIPPHKQAQDLACAEDRVNMCRMAFCANELFEICTAEIDRGEKSYTVETLRYLTQRYPDDEFFLIIGSDMLKTFTEWYKWEEILSMAHVCAASREKGFEPSLGRFSQAQGDRIIYMDIEPFELSSSHLRNIIAAGGSTDGLLDSQVRDYADTKGIYTAFLKPYHSLIEQRLDEKRLYHSECVSLSAGALALQYGADVKKARLAGLLHDVMKNASTQAQIDIILQSGIALTAEERANTKVLHAMAGEAFLRLNTDIDDEEILSAVGRHTTGSRGMSLLDKIVYIADFISADRDYPDVDAVRALAKKSLDEAILYTTRYTINKLAANNMIIHPATVDCYNDALLALREE